MTSRIGILVLCLLTACSCSTKNPRSPGQPAESHADPELRVIPPGSPKLRQIRVEPVRLVEIPMNEVISPAKVDVNPNRISRVLLPVPGKISLVLVKLGDSVVAGQSLLRVEGPDVDAAVSSQLQASGSITQSRSALLKAQSDYDRARDLFDHDAIAKKEVLSAESILGQAKVALEQAIAVQEQSLRRLELLGLKQGVFGQPVEVKAPITGKILEINVAPGEYRNDTNAALMTIVDLGSLWVTSNVPESYIRYIRTGEKVQIKLLAYPDENLAAKVLRIADTVDPQTRTIKVQSELDNSSGKFRPEMYGEVKHTAQTEKVLAVPAAAVVQGKTSFVFLEESPGRFRETPITLGRRSGNLISVLSGLRAGNSVVVDGEMLLK